VVRTDQDVRCERPQRSSVVATTGSLGVATLGCDPLKDGDVPVIEASWKALRSRQGRNHDLSVCDHRCEHRQIGTNVASSRFHWDFPQKQEKLVFLNLGHPVSLRRFGSGQFSKSICDCDTARAEVSLCHKAAKCQLAAEGDPFDTPFRPWCFAPVLTGTNYSRWRRDRAPPLLE
jgi:hypothetical protein